MTEFFNTVKARHKFNAALAVTSAVWVVLDIAVGSYFWAGVQAVLTVLIVLLAVHEERAHRRHLARMERIKQADDIEALLRAVYER